MARSSTRNNATLTYPLVGSFVHHWLVLGPYDRRVALPHDDESSTALPVQRAVQPSHLPFDPVNVTELDRVQFGESEQVWEVTHCQEDHWLAWHSFVSAHTHRQAWGYVQLQSAQAQQVTLTLTANCPVTLWLNGEWLNGEWGHSIAGAQRDMAAFSVTVNLRAGANPLLLQLQAVGVRELSMMAALAVHAVDPRSAPLYVQLPTVTPSPRRRQRIEAIYAQTRLDRAVYGKSDPIRLISTGRARHVPVLLRLQKPSGAIYAETIGTLERETMLESVRGSQLPNGALNAMVMAPFQQFYTEKLRARHTISVLIANHPFYTEPSGHSADERLIEALHTQMQAGGSIYAELAKMAFGWWEQVDSATIRRIIERVLDREADALPDLLGLITMRARMPAYQGFPPSLLPLLDRGLATFAASDDSQAAWDPSDQASQLAVESARYLLAQLYPQVQRTTVQRTTVQRATSAAALVEWMAARGRNGFQQWHSDHDLLVTALAPLLSLAQDQEVRETAASLLDTVAFAVALHSVRGTFGASRARVSTDALRSGRFAPEAALNRLLWGTGGYATGQSASVLAATTALGLAGQSYVLPDAIRTIALSHSFSHSSSPPPYSAHADAVWVQERHEETKVVSLRTPDYLLSSAHSYRTGKRGSREQIWQATLGAEALVFSNHPASYSQATAPGWWVGNALLPRVAQHHDALIALYALPAGSGKELSGLNFTHAYFPIYAFDEYALVNGWAFGRVGNGYLALGALPGFTLVEQGPDAGRELRVEGGEAAWLCQMGRRATDGDFAAFQRSVMTSAPQFYQQRVRWRTPRGDTLMLEMDGPFMVNGQAIALDDFPRHHSPFARAPYPADLLEIAAGKDVLRLHF